MRTPCGLEVAWTTSVCVGGTKADSRDSDHRSLFSMLFVGVQTTDPRACHLAKIKVISGHANSFFFLSSD